MHHKPLTSLNLGRWFVVWLVLALPLVAQQPFRAQASDQGLAIEFQLDHADPGKTPGLFQEGDTLIVRYRIGDLASGTPMKSLKPASWMGLRTPGEPTGGDLCLKKAKTYLGGNLLSKAEIDLNAFFVVALNRDSTLTVVDPLFGFGGSRLLEMLQFESPGDDWLLSSDQKSLYISLPEVGKVVRVDTSTWKTTHSVSVAGGPQGLALQEGQSTLWVGTSGANHSGVTALSLPDLKLGPFIETGPGFHDLQLDHDNKSLFVSNSDSGSVSVIDLVSQRKLADLPCGARPVSLSYSAFAQCLLVADQAAGQLTAIDTLGRKVLATMATSPGLAQVVFAPGGRFAFAINPDDGMLYIADASTNRVLQSGNVGDRPSQIAFSEQLAYILHENTETIHMVPLGEIGEEGKPIPLADFPGGRNPVEPVGQRSIIPALVSAPAEQAVLFPDPENESIYYYTEGMAAPMGNFKNYGHIPRGICVIDRSLQEHFQPGLYETVVQIQKPGEYDAVFYLDSPKIVSCFPFTVQPDPVKEKARQNKVKQVSFQEIAREVPVQQITELSFQISDYTDAGLAGLSDVTVLITAPAGIWSKRYKAQDRGKGVYSVQISPQRLGFFSVFVASPSLGLGFEEMKPLVLKAIAQTAGPVGTEKTIGGPGQ